MVSYSNGVLIILYVKKRIGITYNSDTQAETDVENYQNKEDDVMDYKLLTIRPPNYSEKPVDPCIQFDSSAEIDGTEGTKKVVVQVQTVPLGDAFW